jgi:hypothetical protein
MDDLWAIEHDRNVSLDRDAAQPDFCRECDGTRPDCRPVGAAFLTRLFNLDQHPSRPFAAKCCASTEEFVGPFYRFDTKNEALLNDDCLADIKGADCPRNAQPTLDIRLGLQIRMDLAERTFGDKLPIEKLIYAEHPKTLLLELSYDCRQQAVITKGAVTDAGEQFGRPPVRAQCAQRWAPDAAGQNKFRNVVFAQQGKAHCGRTYAAPRMRYAAHCFRLGRPLQRQDKDVASGGSAGFDETLRQPAASGHDTEPTRHLPLSAGRWRGSSPRG